MRIFDKKAGHLISNQEISSRKLLINKQFSCKFQPLVELGVTNG